ncbi:acyl transferase/acyl hydrolase/lysophospholipase [Infundibulicybe gibba]|nr:acyl transferase/acyl hydrolase/lysophospholipase [Infundibulicybe gibba]
MDRESTPTASTSSLLSADYIDESHIEAFAKALHDDDSFQDPSGDIGIPSAPDSPVATFPSRVHKVSALSDFAPVNLRVKRRKKKARAHEKRHDWLYLLLRWPLLFFIFTFIAAEFSFYVLIRQLVNTKEWISAWRGQKGILRKKLRCFYDWKLVRRVRRSLKNLREKNDARGCLGVLETCIRSNFAGTKELIESYYAEQVKALEFIRESPELTIDEKKRFFKSANTNLGISALCLSGGASFGYYHCGVVKAFLDAGLLPRVITGTSAGGLIAALVCTRTDDELRELLVPDLANRITACEEPFYVWFKRVLTTGARFDSCTFFTRGSMTFKEAYMRTGRILNISVIPADRHSALLASAAVPGILNPVVLMHKLKDGSVIPWNWGSKFKDGSLRVDIPLQALNLYSMVLSLLPSCCVQVNPHVHLFFFAPRGSAGKPVAHRKGKGWRGNFLLSAAEQWLKHELTKNFKVIRDLELLPQLLGQDWSSVFLQRFDGADLARTRLWDWFRLLSDPDPAELERMIRVGEIVTWPKLHMIENRAKAIRRVLQPKMPRPNSGSRSLIVGGKAFAPSTSPRAHHNDLPPRASDEAHTDTLHSQLQVGSTDVPKTPQDGFFTRLRNQSFPSFSPSGLGGNNTIAGWSSDSPSDDDLSVDDPSAPHSPP